MNEPTGCLDEAPLSLEVAEGPRKGSRIPVKWTHFLIGRGLNCHLRPTKGDIDAQHCGVLARDGRFFLCDFNSAAGTYLNDRQIGGEVELIDGDRVRVGPLQFVVHFARRSFTSPERI